MKRTNSFVVEWENPEEIQNLAIGCATLWNKFNYERRQAFFDGEFEFENFKNKLYDKFKDWVGSRTAQTVMKKNDEAWRSFLSLLRKWNNKVFGGRPSPPGYWKRNDGSKELRMLVRCDCYTIEDDEIKLPFGRKGKVKGLPRWKGKQGRLEIKYDELDDCWRAYQSVETEPLEEPKGDKVAFVDVGQVYPLMTQIENQKPVGYKGKSHCSDWWRLSKEIEHHKSKLNRNGDKTSRKLKKLFRLRKRKYRDVINKMTIDFVEKCWDEGVDTIVVGDLTGIRRNAENWNRTNNAKIHNLWSHGYIFDRLKTTAENYGIKVDMIDERGTSSRCIRCGSEDIHAHKRLFKCRNCGLEAHRDAVGVQNISFVWQGRTGEPTVKGSVNGVVAHPEVISI